MTCLLVAYTAQNLGDDMFVDYICRRYPDTQFLIVCPFEYGYAFSKIQNLKVYHSKEALLADSETIHLQILVGGSLFMEPRLSKDIYSKFLENTSYRMFEDIPMIIIGANFGPFKTPLHLHLHKAWFSTMNHISFRDDYSYSLFKDISHITWAPDILFNYPIPKVTQKRTIVISCIYNNNRIGLPDYNEGYYIESLCKIAQTYINMDYSILFASFCEKQGDGLVAKEIMNRLGSEKAMNVSYKGDITEFLSCILTAEYIIGTRYHSIILGWLAGIPVFPISYNSKTEEMLRSYGFKGHYSSIESLTSDFEYVDYNRINNITLPDISLIHDATSHFSFLDSFIFNLGDSDE